MKIPESQETKEIQVLHLYLTTDRNIEEGSTQLRGFLGRKYSKYPEIHHHLVSKDKEGLIYEYPKIQFNIYKNKAIITGIGERAAEILKKIVMEINILYLDQNEYEISEVKVDYSKSEYGILNSGKVITYRFLTPWLALNEKNYNNYVSSKMKEKRNLLKRILIGNILSMSKYLDYHVPSEIGVEIQVSPFKTTYKNVEMMGFKGNFEINFSIPDYLGIGKGVSHGFGTLKKLHQ